MWDGGRLRVQGYNIHPPLEDVVITKCRLLAEVDRGLTGTAQFKGETPATPVLHSVLCFLVQPDPTLVHATENE